MYYALADTSGDGFQTLVGKDNYKGAKGNLKTVYLQIPHKLSSAGSADVV